MSSDKVIISSSYDAKSSRLKSRRTAIPRQLPLGQHYSTVLKYHGGLSSSASTRAAAISMDPSFSADWTSLSSIFDEFRMRAVKITIIPYYRYVTTVNGVWAISFDNDSSGTPSSLDSVVQYGNSSYFGTNERHMALYRRPNWTPSAYWLDVASPTNNPGSIQMYGIDLPTSGGLLYYFVELFCEFRSRR